MVEVKSVTRDAPAAGSDLISREQAVEVLQHEADGWRKQNMGATANAVEACIPALRALPAATQGWVMKKDAWKQAWADRCGIDVTDERVQEADEVGWPDRFKDWKHGWDSALAALPLPPLAQEWVSVKERLPDDDDVLFVTSSGHWIGWRDKDGMWYDQFDDGKICKDESVTHWMPLPASPTAQRVP